MLVGGALGTREVLRERAADREVALSVVLGVDTVSNSRDGGGRVDHYAEVVNRSPRAVRLADLRLEDGRLRGRARLPGSTAVEPGGTLFLPLSVGLDCRRDEPLRRGPALGGAVDVVRADGRAVTVPVALSGAEPLAGVARLLCGLDPLRVEPELSGPVGGAARTRGR